jgi:hypothetical protein
MGRIGPTELFIVIIIIAIPIIAYRLGYKSGRVRGERDALKEKK